MLWWISGAILLLVAVFLGRLFGPSPPIVVSRETTYITAPLKPSGLPDYGQYVLQRAREGVTPDSNAAVLLWQAIWPAELEPQHYEVMVKELGLDKIPSPDHSLQRLHGRKNRQRMAAWLGIQEVGDIGDGALADVPTDDATLEAVDAVLDRAIFCSWTSAGIPPLAEWIAENNAPLDLAVAASRRPRYYSPSPSLLDGSDTALITVWLPEVTSVRNAGRALSARAMWHLGEGRPEDAWSDLLAVHRLARLVSQATTLVEQYTAMAIGNMACEATLALLGADSLSKGLSLQVQQDLAEVDRFSSMPDVMDEFERLVTLDLSLRARAGGITHADGLPDEINETAANAILRAAYDWSTILRGVNRWYDRQIAAVRLPERSQRAEAMAQLDDDLRRVAKSRRAPRRWAAGLFSRRARSRLLSDIIAVVMLPAQSAAMGHEDRANTQLDLTRLAAGLAVYRAEHGAYPEKLDELVPDVVPKVPVDLYNAKPFLYRRDSQGYLLYSAGPNGTDDDGGNEKWSILAGRMLDDLDKAEAEKLREQIPAGADDISIRVPRPVLGPP